MEVEMLWRSEDLAKLDDKHILVNLFDPESKNNTWKPAFYSWMAPDSFNYVLLTKSRDVYINGDNNTKYTATPSATPEFDAHDSTFTHTKFRFSYQSEYVVTRYQAYRESWLSYLTALGGALSLCDWFDRIVLFIVERLLQGHIKKAARKKGLAMKKRNSNQYRSINGDAPGGGVNTTTTNSSSSSINSRKTNTGKAIKHGKGSGSASELRPIYDDDCDDGEET
jgi:hypothetical protein